MRTDKHLDQTFSRAPVADERKIDSWSADKRSALTWMLGIIGAAILGWGIWATQQLSALDRVTAVTTAQLAEVDRSSRERDKQVTDMAAQAQAAIQAQLAQIQAQLAEIQKELRHRP